ncbi:MAG: hypothetical protein J6T83_06355, partial [Paludibacteraceae bacterium]|nr:hypothetical protein [Paludibacteraceae bacterium]
MLYEKKTSALENFLNDLREQFEREVSEDELNIVCEYLDITKPRNNALLGKIEKKYRNDFFVSEYHVNKIVEKEIIRKNNTELAERFIIAIYTLYGCRCYDLLQSFMSKKNLEENPEEYTSRIVKPISDNLGIDSDVVFYSMRMNCSFEHVYNEKIFPKRASKSVLRETYSLMDSACFYRCVVSKAVLLCYLLEQENENLSENGKWAVDAAVKLWEENNVACQKNASDKDEKKYSLAMLAYMTCALGEAAPYSRSAREYFNQVYPKVTKEAVEAAIKASDPFVKFFKYIESNGKNINEAESSTIKVLSSFVDLFKSDKANVCLVTPEYISSIVCNTERKREYINIEELPDRDEWMERLAKTYPEQYKSAISLLGDELKLVKYMSEILQRVDPDSANIVEDLRDTSRRKLADVVRRSFSKSIKGNPYCREVAKYILGEATLDDVRPLIDGSWNMEVDGICDYYSAFGIDEYLARAVTITSLCSYGYRSERHWYINKMTGMDIYAYKETFDILRSCGLSFLETVNVTCDSIYHDNDIIKVTELLSSYLEEIAAIDFS